ncbi:unnamed protein product [Phytophthora lilii]|uniref:Unnamed protein product n=1 Tax=Phytophthora lilii TaxID=2077276 RepID=A0A9W6TUH3_9STRA|nr:unnamed protein product [Phytophthora lilii]
MSGIAELPSCTELSRPIANAFIAAPELTPCYPIRLVVANNHLLAVGLLAKAALEVSLANESSASRHSPSDNDVERTEGEGAKANASSTGNTEKGEEKQHSSPQPTTIQDKYKLPPMEWKTKPLPHATAQNEKQGLQQSIQEDVSPSTARIDYDERLTSAMQRVNTLTSVMKSMRTSFQLFSSDVQQHMNLVSEQLEEISRRRVTAETSQASRVA